MVKPSPFHRPSTPLAVSYPTSTTGQLSANEETANAEKTTPGRKESHMACCFETCQNKHAPNTSGTQKKSKIQSFSLLK